MPAKTSRKRVAPRGAQKPKPRAKPKAAPRRRQGVPEPNAPRSEAAAQYLAMTKLVLSILPSHGEGLSRNDIFDAVRDQAPSRLFPGDTHRMWAKEVLLDLAAKHAIQSDGRTPERWRRA